jgi:pimeloyl-ACP methyl ester carboxylesterase
MGQVNNNGVMIHYEVEGDGPPLTLMHGMGGSIQNWRRAGYIDALKDQYRLVLVDSRGFGQSDKPHEVSAYTRQAKVSDVTAVLDDLGIGTTHYWGYSMGASNGWAMAMLNPERLRSMVLGGYPALPEQTSPETVVRWQSRAKLMRAGMDLYIAGVQMEGGVMPGELQQRLLANDGEAYAAQQLANLEWGVPDADIRAISIPALVYSGTEDHAHPGFDNHEICKRCVSLAQNMSFLPVPGHTHTQTFADREFILPHALKFLAEQEAAVAASV